MESRAAFKTVSDEFLRGTAVNSVDTGSIPTPVTSQDTQAHVRLGAERNTARGIKEAVVITGITGGELAPATDATSVDHYKTFGEI